ncbi:MAG: hypothetical protein EZS28_037684, partial [Streblomastix strix]
MYLVQFIARVSPEHKDQERLVEITRDNILLLSAKPFQDNLSLTTKQQQQFISKFRYNSILYNDDQSSFYQKSLANLTQQLFDNINSTVFVFGTQNSGRDYTIVGNLDDISKAGLIQRVALDILMRISHNTNPNDKRSLYMTTSLFHHDIIIDLQRSGKDLRIIPSPSVLINPPSFKMLQSMGTHASDYLPTVIDRPNDLGLRIVEDKQNRQQLQGISFYRITSIDDVMQLLIKSDKLLECKRKEGVQLDYSHICYTFELRQLDQHGNPSQLLPISKMNIIHLSVFDSNPALLPEENDGNPGLILRAKYLNAILEVVTEMGKIPISVSVSQIYPIWSMIDGDGTVPCYSSSNDGLRTDARFEIRGQ